MKLLQVFLFLSLLLVVPFLVVESSSSPDKFFVRNITRGSSLSLNDSTSPYWLSPSGNLAFGFYQLPCTCPSTDCSDRYVVGIWFVMSSQQTLVWTANHNDLPLHKPSSILFTSEGYLMLRVMPDNKEKPLIPEIQEPVSYAVMHDDGNFVLYGSDSQIVWESFDYPTDTILGGQKLKDGIDLISGNYRLSVRQTDGLIAIYNMDAYGESLQGYQTEELVNVVSDEIKGSVSIPVTLNLDTTGNLYLVGSDDVILKYLYRNKNQRRKQQEEAGIVKEDVHIYRATLDSGGQFNLYKERIDGSINTDHHDETKSPIQLLLCYTYQVAHDFVILLALLFIICCGVGITCLGRREDEKATIWEEITESLIAKA